MELDISTIEAIVKKVLSGMGHTTFTIAGPTGEGLTSAKSFCRIRRCVMKDAFHIRDKQ